jgi:hypothetical protein
VREDAEGVRTARRRVFGDHYACTSSGRPGGSSKRRSRVIMADHGLSLGAFGGSDSAPGPAK